MPRLYNVDHQPHVVDHAEGAVMPGEPYEFTADQIAVGLDGLWSKENPRAGLDAEKAFKAKRDKTASEPESPADTEPDPGDEKEN